MGMGKRDTIAGQLLGGAMVQIPVKRLARALKVDRNKFRFKGGFEPKKKKNHILTTQIMN